MTPEIERLMIDAKAKFEAIAKATCKDVVDVVMPVWREICETYEDIPFRDDEIADDWHSFLEHFSFHFDVRLVGDCFRVVFYWSAAEDGDDFAIHEWSYDDGWHEPAVKYRPRTFLPKIQKQMTDAKAKFEAIAKPTCEDVCSLIKPVWAEVCKTYDVDNDQRWNYLHYDEEVGEGLLALKWVDFISGFHRDAIEVGTDGTCEIIFEERDPEDPDFVRVVMQRTDDTIQVDWTGPFIEELEFTQAM